MKRLLVIWDPDNPMTRVGAVVAALRSMAHVREITFQDVSHRTLPNGAFEMMASIRSWSPEALLWIEGGPLPSDIDHFPGHKVCWLLNTHLEHSIVQEVGERFNRRLAATLGLCADESCLWMPQAAGDGPAPKASLGVTLAVTDPKPVRHARLQMTLDGLVQRFQTPQVPIVICAGQNGHPNEMMYDYMRGGNVVVVDADTDLRGIAHDGDHVLALPSESEAPGFISALTGDRDRLVRVSERSPQIIEHLHTPAIRAEQLLDAVFPRTAILSGRDCRPRVSVLVSCYRWAKRLRACLRSLARQEIQPGELEVVVADPQSPDDLVELLLQVARECPHLRIVHVPLHSRYRRNRGVCINRAFDASTGKVIVGIDADIVFGPQIIRKLADSCTEHPDSIIGVWRVFLDRETTTALIDGRMDPLAHWNELVDRPDNCEPDGHRGVLGYCQVVRRERFADARYPEEFDMVNQSDIVFVERLQRRGGIQVRFLDDLRVLHLWHPRNWAGTAEFF